MLRIAFRLHRAGLIGWLLIGGSNAVLEVAGWMKVVGPLTPAGRLAEARQLSDLSQGFTFLTTVPVHLETMAGYLVWQHYGKVPLFLGIWAVLAGAGAGRGDEERGLTEQWLGAGIGRFRYLATRLAAFALAVALVQAVILGITAGLAAAAGEPIDLWLATLQSLTGLAFALVAFNLGVFAGQLFATRRNAAGSAGAVLLATYMVEAAARQPGGAFQHLRWASPVYWYDRGYPLLPGGSLDGAGLALMLGAGLGLFAAAALLFGRRDLGRGLLELPAGRAATAPVALRTPVPALVWVYEQRLGLLLWALGLAGWGFVTLTFADGLKAMAAEASSNSALNAIAVAAIAGTGHGDFVQGLVGAEWFGGLAATLLAAFAITQVARWAAEDADGRLEMLLSVPFPRWRVVAERALSLTLATALVIAGGIAGLALALRSHGFQLPAGRVAEASLLDLVVVLCFGAAGAAIAAYRPRAALFSVGGYTAAASLVPFFVPMFGWPGWVYSLSVFKLYGFPLSDPLDWGHQGLLAAIVVVGFGVALLNMRVREVGR